MVDFIEDDLVRPGLADSTGFELLNRAPVPSLASLLPIESSPANRLPTEELFPLK